MKLLVAIATLAILSCSSGGGETQASVTFSPSGATFRVTIADEVSEQTRGLMGVESLESDEGMLFVWSEANERSFWMKNTLIPLDLIAIADGKVVGLATMQPCVSDPCAHTRTPPADMVLEVAARPAAELQISLGDEVTLS